MSKLINCLRMIELLQARGKMKIRELAEELEVKERMIQLYKNNLEKAGIMIESTQGRNGGYSISKHTMFPVKNLSLEELEALGFAVDHIRSKGSKVHSSNLKQAMDKLKAVKKMEDDYDKHVYFVNRSIPNNEVLNENHKYIKLLSALHNKRKVKITYHTVSTGEIKERIISPYAFVHYNEFFYCIAMCDLKKGVSYIQATSRAPILNWYELKQEIRFEFFSSVGVLELDSCRIVVKPKFHNGFHDVIQMVLFTEDIPLSIEHDTKGGHDAESLYELLVRLYIKQVEMILERGVTKEYINEENNLNVLRGRLNMRKQLQLNYSRPTKIYCHYDELETNILDNQVLRSVLEVARRLPLTKSTARRVQQLLHEFTNLTDLFHHTEWPRFTYNRLNQHYEYAHKLGYYIWQQQYTNQMYQFSSDSHFSFFIDMNELFEAFVGKWLEQYTPPTTKVHLQKFFKKAMISNETSYHNIKPDIIIETPNEPALVIDTKYKNYGNKKVSNSDIYQLAFYGQFLQKENKPYRAMILYPRYTGEDAKEEVIELLPGTDYAGRLFVRAVPVEKLIEEIKHKNNDYLFDVAARTLSIRMS